jgi:protein-S-isoprenylcysteine O-methyltransferase Ste14
MKRWSILLYGIVNYLLFLGVFLYMVGFLGGLGVPKGIDGPAGPSLIEAVIVNLLLLLVFGLQHSVMARPAFKQWLTKVVPEPIERSTYVLFSNLALALLFWQWRPMGGIAWDIQQPALRAATWCLFAAGWMTILLSTLLINHFDLFGLRQVWLNFRGRPYTSLPFGTPGLYRYVRHPLYVGWLLAFWAVPTMGFAHLAFAVGMTAYILIAIQFEERDLIRYFGKGYEEYRRRVPMLIPRFVSASRESVAANADFRENRTKVH